MGSHGPVGLEDKATVIFIEIPIDVCILKSEKDEFALPVIEADGESFLIKIFFPVFDIIVLRNL